MNLQCYVSIVEEVLNVEGVKATDNLFSLGGDSLSAVNICNKLENYNLSVDFRFIFRFPTVESQVNYLKNLHITTTYMNESQSLSEELLQSAWPSDLVIHDKVNTKNQTATFILSSPRSGSTLLRVMLAGHPELFVPPELHLLSYENLALRKQILKAANGIYLEGTIRAVMDIKKCSASDATSIIENLEQQELATKDFYFLLQKWLANRLLVEKTPGNASRIEALYNIENWFENPRYVILVRHPLATIHSMMGYDKEFFQHFSLGTTSDKNLRYNELAWTLPYYNIMKFIEKIPSHRFIFIKFEDLVHSPEKVMKDLCYFLNIKFCEGLLNPYQNKEHKMLDGVEKIDFAVGDHKFHQYKDIRPEIADAWKKSPLADLSLSDISWKIAEKFGYTK